MSAGIDRFGGVMLLPVLLAFIAFVLIGQPSTWATLTIAGLAMGMMIFLMASGLSLIFGLMDVLNFGHSAFVTAGAFIGATVLAWLGFWVTGGNPALNLAGLLLAIAAATIFGALAGWFFERVVIKPVYQDHLRQILITVGALIVAEELILLIWGGAPIPVPRPEVLTGSIVFAGVSVEIYRIFAFLLGLVVYVAMYLVLNRTRLGLLIRAGVENREMVEALGREYWPTYFDCLARNLKPGGRAAIQFIAMKEELFEGYARNADFIQAYVFPGGLLIRTSEFRQLAAERGLSWEDEEDFGLDYAETLKAWRENFNEAVKEGRLPAGFDRRFCDLWRFYLMYCEGGFRGGGITVSQATLVKR